MRKLKAMLVILMMLTVSVLSLLPTTVNAVQDDADSGGDAGDNFNTATDIDVGTKSDSDVYEGLLDPSDDDSEDWYSFEVSSGEIIFITMSPQLGADFDLELYNENEAKKAVSSESGSASEYIYFVADSSGDWAMRVFSPEDDKGKYTITISVDTQNDADSGEDAGNDFDGAVTIQTENSYEGYLDTIDGVGDSSDFYTFSVAEGEVLEIEMTPQLGANFDLVLYDEGENKSAESTLSESAQEHITYKANSTGMWYLEVFTLNDFGSYTFSVFIESQDDADCGGDAGDNFNEATSIDKGSYTGELEEGDELDIYTFTPDEDEIIEITMTPQLGVNFDLELYDESRVKRAESNFDGSSTEYIYYVSDSSNAWYIKVFKNVESTAYGGYELKLSLRGQDDAGSGEDAGDNFDNAYTINMNPSEPYEGELYPSDVEDWYQFSPTAGEIISVDLIPQLGANFDLALYDNDENKIAESNFDGSSAEHISFSPSETTGSWRVRIFSVEGSGTYTFTVTTAEQRDGGKAGDAPDNFDDALEIDVDSDYTGAFERGDKEDWYKFVGLKEGQMLYAYMSPQLGADFNLEMYSEGQIKYPSQIDGGKGESEFIYYVCDEEGDWRIRIFSEGDTGSYTFGFYVNDQEDAGGGDAGNKRQDANKLSSIPTTGNGYLHEGDTEDWYKFNVNEGDIVSIGLTHQLDADFDLYLYNPSGSLADSSTNSGVSTEEISYVIDTKGEWYISIEAESGYGAYTFTINKETPDDAGKGEDAGNDFENAMEISVTGSYLNGDLRYGDTDDWYRFSLEEFKIVEIFMIPELGVNFDMELYDENQAKKAESKFSGSSSEYISYCILADMDGDYYLRIYSASGEGSYSFKITTNDMNDADSGEDAGNSFDDALELLDSDIGETIEGALYPSDNLDYYSFDVEYNDVIEVFLEPPKGANLDLYLYNTIRSQRASSTNDGSANEHIIYALTEGSGNYEGKWWVAVEHKSGNSAYYDFIYKLTIDIYKQNDADSNEDAGYSLSYATSISGGEYNGELMYGDTNDYYSFYVDKGKIIKIELFPELGVNLDLDLYDTDNSWRKTSSNEYSNFEYIEFVADKEGEWKIRLYYSGEYTSYTFTVMLESQNDAESGGDAGNEFNEATNIHADEYTGYLNYYGDSEDWYQINLQSGKYINIVLSMRLGLNFDIELYDPTNTQRGISSYSESCNEYISLKPETGENLNGWRIRVSAYSYFDVGYYTIDISFNTKTIKEDAEEGGDAEDSYADAKPLDPAPPALYTASLGSSDQDWWELSNLEVGQVINFGLTGDTNGYIYIYNPNNQQKDYAYESGNKAFVSYTVDMDGDWKIGVTGNAVDYEFVVTIKEQDDADSNGDAGESGDEANIDVDAHGIVYGYLDQSSAYNDYYAINLDEGDVLEFIFVMQTTERYSLSNGRVYLYNPLGTQKQNIPMSYTGSPTSWRASFSYPIDEDGNWVLRISGSSSSYSFWPYAMYIRIIAQNDAGKGKDAGNSLDTATDITNLENQGRYTGFINSNDDDYYSFGVDRGQTIEFLITGLSSGTIYLYASGTSVKDSSSISNNKAFIQYTSDESTEWRIRVDTTGSDSPYTFELKVWNQNDADSREDSGANDDQSSGEIILDDVDSERYFGFSSGNEDEDYYKLTSLNPGDVIEFSLTGDLNDGNIYIYDSTEKQVASASISDNKAHITYTVEDAGSHYLGVIPSASSGIYTLVVSKLTQNDAHSQEDAGNDFEDATIITVTERESFDGYIYKDDLDFYLLSVTAGNIIEVTCKESVDITIYNENEEERGDSIAGINGKRAVVPQGESGDWRIRFETSSSGTRYTFIVALLSQNDADSQEDAGNDFESAFQLTQVNSYYEGYLSSTSDEDDKDIYKVSVNEGELIELIVIGDIDGEIVIYKPDESKADSSTGYISYTADQDGDWFLEIGGGNATQYLFAVFVRASSQNDAGSGGDAGGDKDTDVEITAGYYTAYLDPDAGDDEDWYKFKVDEGQVVEFTVIGDFSGKMYLREPKGGEADSADINDHLSMIIDEDGEWFVSITNSENEPYTYEFMLSVITQNDAESDADAGNTNNESTPVTPGIYECYIDDGDDDWYSISGINQGDVISVSVRGREKMNWNTRIFGPDGSQKDSGKEFVTHVADVSGTWKLSLELTKWTKYTLIVSVKSQNDADSGSDASGLISDAVIIETVTYEGYIDIGDHDWYRIQASYGDNIELSLEGDINGNIHITTPAGDSVAKDSESGGEGSTSYTADESGYWGIWIEPSESTEPVKYKFTVSVSFQDDAKSGGDAGNEFDTALAIYAYYYHGYLSKDDDDYYELPEVKSGKVIEVRLTGSTGGKLYLYNPDDKDTAEDSESEIGGRASVSASVDEGTEGKWKIRIDGSNEVLYSFAVIISETSQNDANSGGDAGDDETKAVSVYTDESYDGYLDPDAGDKEDWYKFSLDKGDFVWVEFTGDIDGEIFLYNSVSEDYVKHEEQENNEIKISKFIASIGGAWHMQVIGDKSALYTFEVFTDEQNDADTNEDAGDDQSSATKVKTGKTFEGDMDEDDEDWYKFSVDDGEIITVSVQGDFNGTLYLYDPDGTQRDSDDESGGRAEIEEFVSDKDGYWAIGIVGREGKTGLVHYSFRITVAKNDAPTADFTTTPSTDQTIRVGEEIEFDASLSKDDGTIEDYEWDFGDGETATGKVVKHTYLQEGKYRVKLTVRDEYGAEDEYEITITIEPEEEITGGGANNQVIYGAVGGAVVFLILILIILFIRKKGGRKEEEFKPPKVEEEKAIEPPGLIQQ